MITRPALESLSKRKLWTPGVKCEVKCCSHVAVPYRQESYELSPVVDRNGEKKEEEKEVFQKSQAETGTQNTTGQMSSEGNSGGPHDDEV